MSKQCTAKIFGWLHQVNADAKLPLSAVKVAIRLSSDFNEGKGGMAWPSCSTIADAIGLSEHAVIRAVRALEARGHLRIKWGKQGRGHSNQYWMLERQPDLFDEEKLAPAPVSDKKKPAPAHVFEQEKTQEKTCASDTGKPAPASRKPALASRKPALAQETLTRLTDQPSKGTHRVPKTQPPRVRSAKKKEAGGEDAGGAFELFWSVYPRRIAKEPARKEFAKVTKTTDPQIIIEAAKLYAVAERARIAREGKPECTKYPGNWLRDHRWEDPPPEGAVIDQDGNVVAFEREQEARPSSNKSPLEIYQEWLEENPSLRW